jgi:hypothetical protein
MATLEEREKGEEARFARDRELTFRVVAHRNKLVARWAATKMGFPHDQIENYATEFAVAEIAEHDLHVVVERLQADFMAHGLVVTDDEIHQHLDHFTKLARRDLAQAPPPAAV